MKLGYALQSEEWRIHNICIYLFFIMTAAIFLFSHSTGMFAVRYGFMAAGAAIGFAECLKGGSRFYKPISLAIILTMCWIMCILGQIGYTNYSFSNLIYTVLYIGLSIILLNNDYSHKLSLLIFVMTASVLLIRAVNDPGAKHVLVGNSRNYISILLLLPILLYYTASHDRNRPISVVPAAIYFAVCILAVGRGGILSSGFLLVALLLYKLKYIEDRYMRQVMCLAIIFVTIICVLFVTNLDKVITDSIINAFFSRFRDKGINDVARGKIWSSFFSNNASDYTNVLFGSDILKIRSDGNLHNSFLQAYASFGLAGFMTLLILIIRTIVQGIKRRDALFLILFAELLLRAFTDRLFFQGYCELFLYYFIFYWDYKNICCDREVVDDKG